MVLLLAGSLPAVVSFPAVVSLESVVWLAPSSVVEEASFDEDYLAIEEAFRTVRW